jgi:hypothetical protein
MPSPREHEDIYVKFVDVHQWFPVPFFSPPPKKFDLRDFCLGDYDKFEDACSAVTVEVPAAPETSEKTLEERFREQADKWERETAHLSSPLQRMIHPSYQAILGMSAESPENKRDVVRFMLRDLKSDQHDWFLALSYLTQQNPINPKDYGKTSKVAASWMKWGEEQGLL